MVYIIDDEGIINSSGLNAFVAESTDGEFPINNNNYKMNEHIKSFLITFVVAFAVVLVSQIDTLTLATFENGAIYGVLFAAIRAGVKGVLELLISTYSK